ncbi:hypothetical protein ABFS82_13G171500 [Erythranthe guttata]|uniref:F-box/LRR-repeat protein At4g14103 isoform X2 n=1 Tax=Erythranthe guttata TaxID=4155 RepID=UPI00064D8247|nr:PREDICTED: F-box/LRR-repeat protein At4g14103 isoform X2 [Erythranthe guttata]|eukprot:XP_012827601.1 PREDICTED: F-box/LRR-repeat protein At4g14103 isoform X2 [Erythranthe guttata]
MILNMNSKSMGRFNVKEVYEEQSAINGGYDSISLLPDCILDHILSYLPTKEAVATSVLSKRWKYLWTFVPILDFDDSLLYSSQFEFRHSINVTCFMNFVDKVLLQRDKSNVKRFRLSCRVCFSASRVNEWILSAVKQNVQELDLCLFVEEPFVLPACVFDNEILTVIKLEMNCNLHLPPRISIPSLKTLHLRLVTFPNDNNTVQSLFSSCPFLEELAVLDCEWMNLKRISITIPSLKILIIDDLPFCSVDDLRGCEISIDAGNLIFFKYSGYLSNKINIYGHSSSALALINIPTLSGRRREIGHRTVKLFGGLVNVSSLRISSGTIEALFHAEDMMDNLPNFENLTFLELRGEFRKHSIKLLIKLLRRMLKLEFLHFCEGLGQCEDDSGMQLLPDCALSSLKTVDYTNFCGTNTEIWFLRFLLKNAVVLEKMNVYWSKNSSKDQMNQWKIKEQLHALPKGSLHCALLITT